MVMSASTLIDPVHNGVGHNSQTFCRKLSGYILQGGLPSKQH